MAIATQNMDLELVQYEKRKQENFGKSTLYSGSEMYYYCRLCGVQIETLPESHISRLITICEACNVLHKHGLI
jgi:hypothetical protein